MHTMPTRFRKPHWRGEDPEPLMFIISMSLFNNLAYIFPDNFLDFSQIDTEFDFFYN